MQKSASQQTEKSLAEILIIVVMITILMSVFIYYFFKQAPNYNSTGFDSIRSSFSSKVRIIHGQWLMDKQPRWVVLSVSGNSRGQNAKVARIPVNKKGWVDINRGALKCEKIWMLVMEMPLMLLKSPIIAIEIQKEGAFKGRHCRYSISSGETFEYDTRSGNVTEIKSV